MGLIAVAIPIALLVSSSGERADEDPPPPNIVFILTDDQTFGEMAALTGTQSLIGTNGARFKRAYVSYPLCCPSRASLLTGQYMHNHGVRGNSGRFGGWRRFQRAESSALPVWLNDAGYHTAHVGKYLNGYGKTTGVPVRVPHGWDDWYGLITPSRYYEYWLFEGGSIGPDRRHFYGSEPQDYQTDVLRDKAIGIVERLATSRAPLYLELWFNAPHARYSPSRRYALTRARQKLRHLAGFDERKTGDKPRWLRRQLRRRLSRHLKKEIAFERRRRLEMLDSVDDAIEKLFVALADQGRLEDTYFIFTSDNGAFHGEHRITGGKYLPYEPASRVPLLISGPGIAAGSVSHELVSTLDITQTILELATGSPDPELDGRSLLRFAHEPAARSGRPLLFEGDYGPKRGLRGGGGLKARAVGVANKRGAKNLNLDGTKSAGKGISAPAFRGIRTRRYSYIFYSDGEQELYDMSRDPAQLRNVALDPRYRLVTHWLFRRLRALATCEGAECRAKIAREPAPTFPPQ